VDTSLIAALGLGFLLGLRHAMEADHVAAMSTFASQERTLLRSCLRGTFWGIGHTAALLGAGIAIIAFKVIIPPEFERTVETCIALVLILLGGHVLLRALGTLSLHSHEHVHDGVPHRHVHVHVGGGGAHDHVHLFAGARKPLLLGLLHGLGGGGALVLVVLTTLPSPAAAFLYLLVFGLGSTAGMLVLTGLMGLPFALLGSGSGRLATVLQIAVGAVSVVIGVVMLHAA
jgi:high-affinity nickel-transport protein